VYDLSARQTKIVARSLHCDPAGSTEDLVTAKDIDAVLLLDPDWHGIWPVERACRAGKALYCTSAVCAACALQHPPDWLARHDRPSLAAFPFAVQPATQRLRELLEQHPGSARVVAVSINISRRLPGEQLLASSSLLQPLYLCGELFSASPETISTTVPPGTGVLQVTCSFVGGRVALLTLIAGSSTAVQIKVTAEQGSAVATLPRVVTWIDGDGRHTLRLPRQATRNALIERFVEAVKSGVEAQPGLKQALRAASWLHAVRRSYARRESVSIGDD
jgi:predicted dehydrogenase